MLTQSITMLTHINAPMCLFPSANAGSRINNLDAQVGALRLASTRHDTLLAKVSDDMKEHRRDIFATQRSLQTRSHISEDRSQKKVEDKISLALKALSVENKKFRDDLSVRFDGLSVRFDGLEKEVRELNAAQSFIKPILTNGSVFLAVIGTIVGVVRTVPITILDNIWPLLLVGLALYFLTFLSGPKSK